MKSRELPVLSRKMFDEEDEQFEENVPKKGLFRTVFRKGKVEIQPFTELNPRSDIKFNKLKKLLLITIICALSLTVLLIIKQLTFNDSSDVNTNDVQSDSRMNTEFSSNQLIRNGSIDMDEEKGVKDVMETQPTTSITSTTIASTITTSRTTIRAQSTSRTTITTSTTTAMPTTRLTSTTTTSTTTTTTVSPTPRTTPTTPITTTTVATTSTTKDNRILNYIVASLVINRATVPDKDGFYKTDLSDTYVKVLVNDHYIGETPAKNNTLSPQWNYQIGHGMVLRPDNVIQFELYDRDKYTSHDFIGKFSVKISDLIADKSNGKQIYRYHGSGRLWFTVTWIESYRYPYDYPED